jgi:hypothetical protein
MFITLHCEVTHCEKCGFHLTRYEIAQEKTVCFDCDCININTEVGCSIEYKEEGYYEEF